MGWSELIDHRIAHGGLLTSCAELV